MSTDDHGTAERRITPADVHTVRFTRATMLRPGYNDEQVDRFLDRVGEELARLHAEKAELRDSVRQLRQQLTDAPAPAAAPEAPSDQAVRILATAQQTADSYVAEAEDFSRRSPGPAAAAPRTGRARRRSSAG